MGYIGSFEGKSFDDWRQDAFENEDFFDVSGAYLQCVLFTESQCGLLCLDGCFIFMQDGNPSFDELIEDLIHKPFGKQEYFFIDWMQQQLIID